MQEESEERTDSAGQATQERPPSGTTSSSVQLRQVWSDVTRPKPTAQAQSMAAKSNVSPGWQCCTESGIVCVPSSTSLPNRSGPVSVKTSE